MPIFIDYRESALYKRGAAESEAKTKYAIIVNMLDEDISIRNVAKYVQVSYEYVAAIKAELYSPKKLSLDESVYQEYKNIDA